MTRTALAALTLLLLVGLTACETVKGAGRDMQSAGGAVQDAANQAEQ